MGDGLHRGLRVARPLIEVNQHHLVRVRVRARVRARVRVRARARLRVRVMVRVKVMVRVNLPLGHGAQPVAQVARVEARADEGVDVAAVLLLRVG